MNNQSFFDRAFILERITECEKMINFHVRRDFARVNDDFESLFRIFESYSAWLCRAVKSVEFSVSETLSMQSEMLLLQGLVLNARQVRINAQAQQVSESTPSAALPVLRLLGPEPIKLRPVHVLNEEPGWEPYYRRFHPYFRTTLTVTKRILSHTRPVGGLA